MNQMIFDSKASSHNVSAGGGLKQPKKADDLFELFFPTFLFFCTSVFPAAPVSTKSNNLPKNLQHPKAVIIKSLATS